MRNGHKLTDIVALNGGSNSIIFVFLNFEEFGVEFLTFIFDLIVST